MIVDISTALPEIAGGKIKALGTTSPRRTPLVDLPTVGEQGLASYGVVGWFGGFAPAGTPEAIVNRLHAEIVKAIAAPDVRERLVSGGIEPVTRASPARFASFIRAEAPRWGKVVRDPGIKGD